ncbi:hypothetical protein M4914_07750 [Streptomyces somaliensis DSM 40738]|uniref:Uncharacterized protein n=1 Tax=Streptomyces somaliensis (strain ATCC 33201 / DSM 40738 / JCM 12659 / KCTC 9044 / NCTC 11332 / NRRL B-12077 / IP 733) TaxID=1134445 RepID=A0AA44DCQ2_STRE0|nr:hypothetical protein [Streptomyces somaliensis]MCQ0022856.1 hypothetical protein [Streptomyces somaliensis DSM 40738]NKY14043.1 hypothetical protein [Streptomyces somaliensis DSM 40738]
MRALEVFARALRGDRESLEALRRDARVLCVAEALSTVLHVVAEPDGGQRAVLATVGPSGGGIVSLLEVPRSFRVEDAGHDATHLVLRAADGRTVRATPGQFRAHVRLLPPEQNPSYEEQLTEAFLAAPLRPEGDWPSDRTPPVRCEGLGTIAFDADLVGYGVAVAFGGRSLWLSFDAADAGRTAELAPHARGLVEALTSVGAAGGEFLWHWGSDGTESPEEEARFLDALRPGSLVVYRSGDFEVHFDDTSGDHFPEGYWPAVRYRADRTPVAVSVEA